MHAFHFGERGRELYGVHEAPAGPSSVVAVLGAAWGRERLAGHAALRRLARVLAEGGFHAFRFDYGGTGDSAGDGRGVTLASMLGDLETAVEEAAAVSQATDVVLIGVRLGGTLASLCAEANRDVAGAVLWDPVVDGDAYLASLRRSTRGLVGESWDVDGYLVDPAMQDELSALRVPPPPGRAGFRPARGLVAEESATEGLEDAGWTVERYDEAPPWRLDDDFGSAALPAATIARIVEVVGDA